jgi:hypothetical protein
MVRCRCPQSYDRRRQDFQGCSACDLFRPPEKVREARLQIICEWEVFLHDDHTGQGVDRDVQLWQVGLHQ